MGESDPEGCLPALPFGCSELCTFWGVGALRGPQGDREISELPSPLHHLVGMHMHRDSNFAGAQQTLGTQGICLEYLFTAKYLIMQGNIPLRQGCLGFIKEAAEIIVLSPWAL